MSSERGVRWRRLLTPAVKNVVWTSGGNAAQRMAQFAITIYIARTFGAERLGLYALIYGAAMAAASIVGAGMAPAVSREVAASVVRPKQTPVEFASTAVICCALIALTLNGLIHFDYASPVTAYLGGSGLCREQAACITILWSGFAAACGSIGLAVLASTNRFLNYFRASLMQAVLFCLLIGSYALLEQLWTLHVFVLVGIAAGAAITLFLAIGQDLLSLRLTAVGFSNALRSLAPIALPTYLSNLLFMPVTTWAMLILANSSVQASAHVGSYAAAMQWQSLILFLPTAIAAAVAPDVTRASLLDHKDMFRQVARQAKVVGSVSFVGAVVIGLSHRVVASVYGDVLPDFAVALWLLLGSGVLFAITNAIAIFLLATRRMWIALVLTGLWSAIFLVSATYLAHYGASGLATANLLAHFVHASCVIGIFVMAKRLHARASTQGA